MNSGVLISSELFPSYRLLLYGCVLILVSILGKLAVVPFHAWITEVYKGMPVYVTALVVIIPNFALYIVFLRLAPTFYWSLDEAYSVYITSMSIGCVIIGGFGGLGETNLLRIIGFSSIVNIGYILLAFQTHSMYTIYIGLVYVIAYSITVLNIFSFLFAIRIPSNSLVFDSVNHLAFLQSYPGLIIIFCTSLFSLAGLPPFGGFFSKLFLFQILVAHKSYPAAVLLAVISALSIGIYLKLIVSIMARSTYSFAPLVKMSRASLICIYMTALLNITFIFTVFPLCFIAFFLI